MHTVPEWFCQAAGCVPAVGELRFPNAAYRPYDGVWMPGTFELSRDQQQTGSVFGHKWQREETYTSPAMLAHVRQWLFERYSDAPTLVRSLAESPVVLDAGCGAAMSAIELFGSVFRDIRYIGVDVSEAVFVARQRVAAQGFNGVFVRDDITRLPFSPGRIDCIFSEGVLHHTDSTKDALGALVPLLRSGGLFLFYVYNKKGPVREFTDDYIRDRLRHMPPGEAWEALAPLTELGRQLGGIDAELDLPEGIPLLGVTAGRVSLQMFFYWHVCKAYYRPDLAFEEMQHINFDWFAPKNAHRQTPEEVREWCAEFGMRIRRFIVEPAGITVIAEKQ